MHAALILHPGVGALPGDRELHLFHAADADFIHVQRLHFPPLALEKSQLQNKAKAFALLKAKLYDMEQQQRHDAEAELFSHLH